MTFGRICSAAGGEICTTCKRTCRLDNQRRNAKTVEHGVKRAHFQALRKTRLELDRHACQLRLRGCKRKATTVHLRPGLAGDHDAATIADVVSACAHCHGVADASRA